ncbi:hypothetical protein E2F43_18715 [Seongchinamella unica]|uniref:Uncharacterized protein n=1 Tax=Seongchinamella unica TaxID=2547392 RepID=A0A4R5LMW9_9GAMM|nr:hypothetical protein [Seongchinamella unica]TDG11415.1 hypothetical protein E2F43_18715 [Seongchinamella unica]
MLYRIIVGLLSGVLLLPAITVAGQPVQSEAGATVDKPGSNPLVAQAIADLTVRESMSPDDIELVSFESVTWPDASLGCPHPGMRYRQVPVDGARIILRSKLGLSTYHSGGGRPPFPCPRWELESGKSDNTDK